MIPQRQQKVIEGVQKMFLLLHVPMHKQEMKRQGRGNWKIRVEDNDVALCG